MTEVATPLAEFDRMPPAAARDLLHPVCASDAWLDAVVGARPYATLDELFERSDATLATLGWSGVEQALASHPRIGERAGGADQESAWSREEQAGAATADADAAVALQRGNADYERHFDHVFLICATGRSPQQILAALHERLDNDPETERDVVRRELAAIARLRIARILH